MVSKLIHPDGTLFDDTPRGILEALLVAGGITVALTAAPVLLLALGGLGYALKESDKGRKRKLGQYGAYLKRRKYIAISQLPGRRARISLTSLGRRRALSARARRALSGTVARPQKWDGTWRLILFDIPAEERQKRNAFRSFIRRIGAVMLQKSVWIHPFDCTEQVNLLRDHFSLSSTQLRLVLVTSIEDDQELRRHFRI